MKKSLIFAFFLATSLLRAQTLTTVTATITDPSGQVFVAGTAQADYQRPAGKAGVVPLSNGIPILEHGAPLFVPLDTSGHFSIQVADLSTVSPTGGFWVFTICPNASAPCTPVRTASVVGASVDLTAELSAGIVPTIVPAQPTLARAYNDGEIIITPSIVWLDVTLNVLKYVDALDVIHIIGGGGGSGSVTNITISGTANEITASGTCNVTTSGTCTLSFPNTLVVPGTLTVTGAVDLLNINGTTQCLQADASGNLTGTGGPCGNIFGSLTAGVIPQAQSATAIEDSSPVLDNGNTTALTLTYAGTGGINALKLSTGAGSVGCGSATGCWSASEGTTTGTPTAGHDYFRADLTTHQWLQSVNGGPEIPLGSAVSLTASSPIVITPSPTTGTGVISCPTCGTGSSSAAMRIPIYLRNPVSSTGPGNAFSVVKGIAAWANNLDEQHWEFASGATGAIEASVMIPHNVNATPAASVICRFFSTTTAAASNVRLQESDYIVGATGNYDQTFTTTTAQTVAVPTTAFVNFNVTFTPNATLAADSELWFKFTRLGADGADTDLATLALSGCQLQITEDF